MIKASIAKLRVAISKLCWEIILWTSAKIPTDSSSLPDLCATDNAADAEQYIDRLNELLVNRSKTVREIAITAPYAGGKSSILKTYMRKFPFHIYTCISLSDFNEDFGKSESNSDINKIEKSIVQQILYRTSSDSTPNSRFRRIFPKPFSYFEAITQSATLLIWGAVASIPFTSQHWITSTFESISQSINIFNKELWIASYLIAMPLLLLKDMIKKLGPITLTKMNVFQAELAFDKAKNDSVFNTYLEEIIYYFSATKSDVVIFEDLDRLKESKIFIKLKELNKLINDSKDVQQDVRFIYATNDDLFNGKDRTKFFDSIIPIIPVSHRSNSYPQLKALLQSSSLLVGLSDDFLRDISVYLDDMRMIKNIVTEYGIYKSAYERKIKQLEWYKLFSFIVYKNLYCVDFAKLNEHEGELATAIDSIHGVRNAQITELEEKRNDIKENLIQADQDVLSSIEELNAVYISIVLREGGFSQQYGFPYLNSTPFTELFKQEPFDALFRSTTHVMFNNPNSGYNHNTGKRFNSWSETMSPSYADRRKFLQNKQKKNRAARNSEIRIIEDKLATIRNMSIKELISEFGKDTFFDASADSALIHLLEKGYIDEHYHLYISHFHEGQLSKSDMDFVMAVKNRSPIENQPTLSNCAEIIKYFSKEDYSSPGTSNPDLINFLLSKKSTTTLNKIVTDVVKKNDSPLGLLDELFNRVHDIEHFTEVVIDAWPNVLIDIITSTHITNENKSDLLFRLLTTTEVDVPEEVGEFLSTQNVSLLIPQNEEKALKIYDKLKAINVKFNALPTSADTAMMENILAHEIFLESFENIAAIFGVLCNKLFAGSFDLRDITEGPSSLAKDYIANNANYFADLISQHRVLLSSESDYINIFNNDDVSDSHKIAIIKNCNFKLSSLENLSTLEELIDDIFLNQRILPTWGNLSSLLEWEEVDETVNHYLSTEAVCNALAEQDESGLDEDSAQLISIVLLRDEIELSTFEKLLPKFIEYYDPSQFRKVSPARLKILLSSLDLACTVSNFAAIHVCDKNLAHSFLEQKFGEFRKQNFLPQIHLTHEDIMIFLDSSMLDIEEKKYLISAKEDFISFTHDTVKHIVPILLDQSSKAPQLKHSTISTLLPLIDNEIERVSILISQIEFIEKNSIWSFVELLGAEYKQFSQSKGSLYLEKNDYNENLIESLKLEGLVSSHSIVERDKKEVFKINLKRS